MGLEWSKGVSGKRLGQRVRGQVIQGSVAMRQGEMSLKAFKQGVPEVKCSTSELSILIKG